MSEGFVALVGAGPWDPELLTLAAVERLARADVVIVDYLVNPATLVHCRPDVQVFQRATGPHGERGELLEQREVNQLMVEHAKAGRYVVRLKGGDPMMFGRGAEEASHLRAHGIEFEFVPGVSSPIAAPEAAGIPITHRDHTPSVSFVSGYEAYEKAGLAVAWEHLANSAGTLVLMMSVKNARRNAERLIAAGRSPETPTAVVRWGTRGIQRTVVGTLADIADRIAEAGIRAPAVMIVGEVVRLREQISWFERRPLFGKRVVVTRAAGQAGGLVNLLASRGADAVAIPCLEFAPASVEDQQALDRALADLHAYAGVIVSSPNGVDALFAGLARVQLDVRVFAGKQVAAIGTGTAEAMLQRGLRADLVPDEARSEGLIDALRDRGLLGARWLQLRADEGRPLLAAAVAEAGGELELIVGYRTVRPRVSSLLLNSLLPIERGGEGVDAVCFASGRTARYFLELLSETHDDAVARELLAGAKVVAIGPVTAAAIEALGLRVDAVANEQSERGLADAVARALAE